MELGELVKSLLLNICLMLVCAFIFSIILRKFRTNPLTRGYLGGGLYGLIALFCMFLPITVAEGIIIDMRVPVVTLAALSGGLFPGLIAAAFPSAYRVFLGGTGTLAGLLAIVCAAGIGGLLHRLWKIRNGYPLLRQVLICSEITAWTALLAVSVLPATIDRTAIFIRLIPAVPLT